MTSPELGRIIEKPASGKEMEEEILQLVKLLERREPVTIENFNAENQ